MACPLYRGCSFKRFQSHYIDRGGIKFVYLVLSIVARFLIIQCPFIGVSTLRDSTEAASLHFMFFICNTDLT